MFYVLLAIAVCALISYSWVLLIYENFLCRRKRGERDLETPGEFIVRKLNHDRIEELKILIEQDKQRYK